MLAQDDDGYAECYPSYFDAAGTIYDSEDEDAAGKPKGAAEGEGEEEGKEKDKKKGGGDARREAIKAMVKEQNKLATELTKIKGIFEEKGYKGYEGAFAKRDKSERGDEGDAAPAPVEEAALPGPTKKRRI